MTHTDQVKLEEYRALLEEHRRNRGYIFGSPVVVLSIVAAVIEYANKAREDQFILSVSIFIITFSLWFLGNRLRSDARIVSYIQLVHEGEYISRWIGWESILRQYRIWMETHKEDLEKLQDNKKDPKAIPCALMFYPAILSLYSVLVLSTVTLIIIKSIPISFDKTIIGFIFAIASALLFLYYALGPMRPRRLNAVYEVERANWLCIFEEMDNRKKSKNEEKERSESDR
jgi:hypothetical protein